MQHQHKLSTLMTISWQIQKTKKTTRAKSLSSAWAITQNEDITVYYLVKRHSTQHSRNKPVDIAKLSLFIIAAVETVLPFAAK